VPISQVYAIGDYYNDLQLLAVAGCSAAPKNAPQDIQDSVDYVCCDHHEGAVADYIRYIEQRLKKG
jgi:hydroxymethylpyrimidine pyrophosphatase-like HAD family hydrolase